MGGPAQVVVGSQGGPAGDSSSQRPGLTSLEGRGVLPRRWSVLKEGMQGVAVPNGPGSPLGISLGDRGLLPLLDTLPTMGAGVVAGGLIPYLYSKDAVLRDLGASSRTGGTNQYIPTNPYQPILSSLSDPLLCRARAAWPQTAHHRGHTAHSGRFEGALRPFTGGFRLA